MKRHAWRLLLAAPAVLGLALAGCYQSAPQELSGPVGVAPASTTASTTIDNQPAADGTATDLASADAPRFRSVSLSVPGMT